MIFTEPVSDLLPYEICGYLSENGKWKVGVRQMLFGRRVFCYPSNEEYYLLDYCTGDDLSITVLVLLSLLSALRFVDETVSPSQLKALFPIEKSRPIYPNDMECFGRIVEMANIGSTDIVLPAMDDLKLTLVSGIEKVKMDFLERSSVNQI